jgi:hypothetical protein
MIPRKTLGQELKYLCEVAGGDTALSTEKERYRKIIIFILF